MSASEVEEQLAIESGSNLVDVDVLEIKHDNNTVVARVARNLRDTSLLVFTERSTNVSVAQADGRVQERRIALIKLGPDVYYPLEKDKTLVYRVDSERYLLPPTSSTASDQYLMVNLTVSAASAHIKQQIEEIFAFFANLVDEVSGASPELDAVRRLLGVTSSFVSAWGVN